MMRRRLTGDVAVVRRIEKEKNQMKTEIEDLRAQIDHVTKAKVRVTRNER